MGTWTHGPTNSNEMNWCDQNLDISTPLRMYRRTSSRSRSRSTGRRTTRSTVGSRARGSTRASLQARDSSTFAIRTEVPIVGENIMDAMVNILPYVFTDT